MEQLNFDLPRRVEQDAPEALLRHMFNSIEFILNEDVCALEERLAAFVGAPFCAAVSDAASGVALALACAGIGIGDAVFCAALGCAIPVQGIMLAGASPLFVDINPNTYAIDPYCAEHALKKLSRLGAVMPKALIATDIFGAPCQYDALEHICNQYGIVLIEDMSSAFGAVFAGKAAGNFGRFAVASFSGTGPLEEPGGGAVFCRNEYDAKKIRSLRRVSKQQPIWEPGKILPCMSSTDAVLINAKLEHYMQLLEHRRKAAGTYRKALHSKVRTQQPVCEGESSYSQLVVTLPREGVRTRVMKRMYSLNIPCGPPPCGMQTACNGWNRVMLTNTLNLSGRLLSLPIHPYLSDHVVKHICRCLLQAMHC